MESTNSEPRLIAYPIGGTPPMRLVPATQIRAWMDATRDRFAYRCLPMLMANQSGWFVLNTHRLCAIWTGGDDPDDLKIEYLSGSKPYPAVSHFGYGVLTWHLPYLFRTAPGYNLSVRGPTNWPKDGIAALDGVVETDWSVATFTMNWKLTRVGQLVVFEEDEPICMLAPQRRGELERLRPQLRNIRDDADVAKGYLDWSHSRSRFLDEIGAVEFDRTQKPWQRHYFQGTAPGGSRAPTHQTRLNLRNFEQPPAQTATDQN